MLLKQLVCFQDVAKLTAFEAHLVPLLSGGQLLFIGVYGLVA